jgi:signal transduction histidine kinase
MAAVPRVENAAPAHAKTPGAARFTVRTTRLGASFPPFGASARRSRGERSTLPRGRRSSMADDSLWKTARHLGFVLFGLWLGAMLYIVLRYLSGMLTEHDFRFDFLASARYITIACWMPWIVMAPFVVRLARRLPIRPDDWIWPLGANVSLCLAIALVHGIGASYYYHFFGVLTADMATYEPWQHTGHFLFGDDMLLLDAIAYAVLAADLNIGKFHRVVRQNELDAARLGETLAELRLQTLRMQINPHFMFNSLNAVCVLVNKNERESAVEMINKMSGFLRRTLDGDGEQWVTLDSELGMTAEYLGIARFRFGERLRIRQDCDAAARDIKVPSMLLQPLVENAVVHGVAEHPGVCELVVRCALRGNRLSIEVSDDGAGSPPRSDPRFKEGIGLRNVRQRLEQLYGADHSFTFDSEPGKGARVTIDIPLAAHSREAVA